MPPAPDPNLKQRLRGLLQLRRAVGMVWRCAPGWTVLGYALTVLQGLVPLAALYLVKLIVDAVTEGLRSPDRGAAFKHTLVLIALAGGVAVFQVLVRSLEGLVSQAQSQITTDFVTDILHSKSVEVDLGYYEDPSYYDSLHRAQQEAPYRPTRIVSGLAQLGQGAISFLAMAGLLVTFHWAVAVVLFAAAIPGVLVKLRYSGQIFAWQRERTRTERRIWYYHWMLTDGGHAKEIRLFGLGRLFRERYQELRRALREDTLRFFRRRARADLLAQAAASTMVYGTYGAIAYGVLYGDLSLGQFVMYFQAFQRGLGALQELLGSLAGLYEDNLFLTNFTEFMDLKPSVREPETPTPLPEPARGAVRFDGVTFQYPSQERPALKDLHFEIRPGEVAAFVGENGSGKTTLIKLLCRLYDPVEGAISVDGVDVRAVRTERLRRNISVIFQDYARYGLTARENIWLGNVEIPPSDPRVEEAARHSGADHAIEALPERYDSVLGRWFEEGHELSVGEWQKVALARAYLREAPIVVLDEPTSSMDALAECEVFGRFRAMVRGKTAILISHRFSTVRMADRIFVLAAGRLIESGSHDELMTLGGRYAAMFQAQASSYR
jgi:ATP-binding cassette, subfamily B, bacterial